MLLFVWLLCAAWANASTTTVEVTMPSSDAEMAEAISGQNSVFVTRVSGQFGHSGDVTLVRVDLSRLCDAAVPSECFSLDWTLFARLEPQANFTLPLQQRLLFKSRAGVLPVGATTKAAPVWTQQFQPWELANVLDPVTRGVFYFHVYSPSGFDGSHTFAFDRQPFALAVVLRRCHVLENRKEVQVQLYELADGSHHDAALAHYWIYDRVVPPPREQDAVVSYFSARLMLRNELALILHVCKHETTPHAVQLCLTERDFWGKSARQFSGKRFALELAAYLANTGVIDHCRVAAEQIGAVNVGALPIALATSACADSLCDNYCMRGVVITLVRRAFGLKSASAMDVDARSALVDVRIEAAHVCASLINESELPECLFAVGMALGGLNVDRGHAINFCNSLNHYEPLLQAQECNEGYDFGLARQRVDLQIRTKAKGATTGVGIDVAEFCVVNSLHAASAYDCAKNVGKVLHDLLESAWAATQVCKTFIPPHFRLGGLVPPDAKTLVGTCEKGVAAAESAQETLNFDAQLVLHNLENLTSNFYVVAFGQNTEPVFDVVRVQWYKFVTTPPPASNQNALVIFSESRALDNARMRELLLAVSPYYRQFYESKDTVKQQRELAGQTMRFYVVYEGHGAVWHDVAVEINDAVPEFRLSTRAGAAPPPPTAAPTPHPPTTTAKTKAPKTTTTKAHKTKAPATAEPPSEEDEAATDAPTTTAVQLLTADSAPAASSAGLVTPLVVAVLLLGLLVVAVLRWRAGQHVKSMAQER